MKKIKFIVNCLIIACFISCASTPPIPNANLSKTRELYIPEFDSIVYISGIQYINEKKLNLSGLHTLELINEDKKFAVFSIQIHNVKENKDHDLSSIVLIDDEVIIRPESVKFFKGDSVGFEWDVISRTKFNNYLIFSSKTKFHKDPDNKIRHNRSISPKFGTYTINLIYAVDKNKIITKAKIFGQTVEFDTEFVILDVLHEFR